MIDFRDLFHVGVRVPDLDGGMDVWGERLGLVWAVAR
jgi:hypothetical protein